MPKQVYSTRSARIERAAHVAYFDGATEIEIANEFGIKPVTVRDWKKTAEWRAAITTLRNLQNQLAVDRLAALLPRATAAIEACLESENISVKFRAAIWLLERSNKLGHSPPETAESPTDEIDRFVKAVVESADEADGE